jgi:hypothetical protein
MELSWEQEYYRIIGKNPAGVLMKEPLGRRSGRLIDGIEHDYDEKRHAIDFMVGRTQLSNFVPVSERERVDSHYSVKRLSLTFHVDVWQRDSETYETQAVTHIMEDLDVEWQS